MVQCDINKITLLHQVGISNYFMSKMHGQTTLKNFYFKFLGIFEIHFTLVFFMYILNAF